MCLVHYPELFCSGEIVPWVWSYRFHFPMLPSILCINILCPSFVLSWPISVCELLLSFRCLPQECHTTAVYPLRVPCSLRQRSLWKWLLTTMYPRGLHHIPIRYLEQALRNNCHIPLPCFAFVESHWGRQISECLFRSSSAGAEDYTPQFQFVPAAPYSHIPCCCWLRRGCNRVRTEKTRTRA